MLIIWPFYRVRTIKSVQHIFSETVNLKERVLDNSKIQKSFEL